MYSVNCHKSINLFQQAHEIFRKEFLGQNLNFKLASTMGHKGKIIPQPSTKLT